MIKKIFTEFKKWINTPPNKNDLFGVRIREAKQTMFPCKHDYELLEGCNFKRKCKWCGDYQIMVYKKFGPIRIKWESSHI